MIDEQGPTEEEMELLPGGDFIAPDVPTEVRDFIQACRRLIYSEEFTPMVKQALTGAGSLVDGIAPILVELITRAEDKMGPLDDQSFQTVVAHLAGTLVSTAKMLGDPEAEDAQTVVQDVVDMVTDMMSQGEAEEAQEMPPEQQMGQALGQLR